MGGDRGAPCEQRFLSLDKMVRRTLWAYSMWDTICTLILDPQNDGAPACGYLGEGDKNFHTGHQTGARQSSVTWVVVSLA